MECVFCNIVKGRLGAYKIYESENYLAFLDINPRSKGHCLVIPKDHYSSILELPEEMIYGLFNTVKIVTEKIVKNLNAKGINICINNGKDAGQVIPHLHVHIIPRYGDDRGEAIEAFLPVREELRKEFEIISKKIKM
jgi:histidine triad (HIT) family protein